MKNTIKNIAVIVIIAIICIVVGYVIGATKTMSETETIVTTEDITITETTTTVDTNEDIYMIYNDASAHTLAVLVSNKDLPIEMLNKIAISNDYVNYNEMINHLVSIDELYYIPEFISEDGFKYESTYTVDGTIIYEDALEMGIIK